MASKDLYEKDLYAILGVKKSDSADAIKKQYRKLARELHPDKTKGDKKLEDRFKSVSEAYEVLSDDAKRADYDQMREAIKSGRIPNGGFHPGAGGFQGNMSQEDLQNLFGGGGMGDVFGGLFGGGGRRGPRRGPDYQSETTISFRDSIYGKEITLRGENSFTARIPAGVKDGAKIKLKGRGGQGEGGPGDMYVIVHVAPHPIFTRDENDLLMKLPVTFTEAALGADIPVPTLDGDEVKVRLAPGTSNGKVLRLKGRGITRNHHTGDLLITIDVQVPQRVDGKAKEALEKFAEATADQDPRADLKQKSQA